MDMDQIKTTTVKTRVTYIEGTIDPALLYDAPPINLCVSIPLDFLTPRHKTKEDGFIRAIMFMAAAGPLNCGGGKNESDLNYVMTIFYGRNIKTNIERSLDIPVVKEMRALFGFGSKDCYGFKTREDVHAALEWVSDEYMTKAEKAACEALYPSRGELGIETDKEQMTIFSVAGVNMRCRGIRITEAVRRSRNHYPNPRMWRVKI
ncbi:TPA: hypothetical protein RHY41_004386 [Escherichia coli]|nr:hypothetical protein [Escherichia coli]EJD4214353.1 hypothetical protein [Escherichia coli]HBB7044597.1 hypothetical protein [Escherichia coli]HDV2374285.1 hypothetical protein [Escherichia coli]